MSFLPEDLLRHPTRWLFKFLSAQRLTETPYKVTVHVPFRSRTYWDTLQDDRSSSFPPKDLLRHPTRWPFKFLPPLEKRAYSNTKFLSALSPYSRKPGLFGPNVSICAKGVSRGVHNIAFLLFFDSNERVCTFQALQWKLKRQTMKMKRQHLMLLLLVTPRGQRVFHPCWKKMMGVTNKAVYALPICSIRQWWHEAELSE